MPLRRALLALCLMTLAALTQGCLVGRDLYYVEDPPSKDQLRATGAPALDGGAPGTAAGDASTDASPEPPRPPAAAPTAPDSEVCNPIAAACVKGGGMEYCIKYSAGACAKITYKHDGKVFSCGCNGADCTTAYYGAYTSCQDAAGACTDLTSCCNAAQPAYQPSCFETVKTYAGQAYGDVACKSVVNSYRASKLCP